MLFFLGLESSPQEEFLSLLGGARISPALNQFLVNSLGEVVSFTCLIFFRVLVLSYTTKLSCLVGCEARLEVSMWYRKRASADCP